MSATSTRRRSPARRPERGTCQGCRRPYGRRRAPRTGAAAAAAAQAELFGAAEVVACDQCWHLSERSPTGPALTPAAAITGVTSREGLQGGGHERGEGESPAGRSAGGGLRFSRAVDELLAAAVEYDRLHPIDRLLVSSGIRWLVLRHIAVPARMQLAAWVLERVPAPHTAAAVSDQVWMDAVDERIAARTGTEFRYRCKRVRYRTIAHAMASCADRDGRPLTWVTQAELAAVAGCSTKTVQRCVKWLRSEDLLLEVVPGCRLPQQHVPDGETAAERADREARLHAAVAAEEAAMARARRELDLVRSATSRTATTASAAAARRAAAEPQLVLDEQLPAPYVFDDQQLPADPAVALVHLAPVYELRVPRPADQLADPLPHLVAGDILTSANTPAQDAGTENVSPPQVFTKDLESNCVQAVDNCGQAVHSGDGSVDSRRAPRGPQPEEFGKINKSDGQEEVGRFSIGEDRVNATLTPPSPADGPARRRSPRPPDAGRTAQSHAVQVAQWLLVKKLRPELCEGVSVRWLAAQIRRSELLGRHGWSREDLLDQINGWPEYLHLPRIIREPRAWIRARLARANPALPPSVLHRLLPSVQQELLGQQRRVDEDAVDARRTAIAACGLCDEHGWLSVAYEGPQVVCSHVDGGY